MQDRNVREDDLHIAPSQVAPREYGLPGRVLIGGIQSETPTGVRWEL